ncbi:MAG: hypothetical protein NTV78_04980 [Caldiserica bacterium]|nr:hypothetical protein [Caldisericota bacterium]
MSSRGAEGEVMISSFVVTVNMLSRRDVEQVLSVARKKVYHNDFGIFE